MIRVLLTSVGKAYGFDVTDWEIKHSDLYDNLLTEEDILMYDVSSNEIAEDWCLINEYDYELVKPNENK